MSAGENVREHKIFLKIVSATYFLDELSSAGSLSG